MIVVSWPYLVAFVAAVVAVTWACARLCRNGGSSERGTPWWDAACNRGDDFGRQTLELRDQRQREAQERLWDTMSDAEKRWEE